MSLIIGLTGGIGSGKSTVAALFAEHGAGIIDTDAIAHFLTQAGGEAISSIRAAFGNDYLTSDGALDRAKMRELIFSDATAKQRLEHILHPLIREQAKAQLRQLQASPYILVIVPLLAESPAFRQLVQRVLVVDCDEDTQVARVIRPTNPRDEYRVGLGYDREWSGNNDLPRRSGRQGDQYRRTRTARYGSPGGRQR